MNTQIAPSLTLKDSGARRDFGTGSVRDAAAGKGTPHLLPFRAIGLAALQMERGMQKYGARNWERGQPLSSYLDSAFRHLTKHWLGYTDEDHLAAYVWNALCYAETAERIRLGLLPAKLDDRPAEGRVTPEEMGAPAPILASEPANPVDSVTHDTLERIAALGEADE